MSDTFDKAQIIESLEAIQQQITDTVRAMS